MMVFLWNQNIVVTVMFLSFYISLCSESLIQTPYHLWRLLTKVLHHFLSAIYLLIQMVFQIWFLYMMQICQDLYLDLTILLGLVWMGQTGTTYRTFVTSYPYSPWFRHQVYRQNPMFFVVW